MDCIVLKKASGIRFQVKDENFSIELKFGSAEIFGADLQTNKNYSFPSGARVLVFTWYGCTLNMNGAYSSEICSSDSTIGRCLCIHNELNSRREMSRSNSITGPRVLVVGPTDMGKSSLCKILCNYAVRSLWKPIFVDLDLGQNEISLPGTIGAISITEQIDIKKGFLSPPYRISHFGCKSPEKNGSCFKFLISRMADSVNKLQREDQLANFSGLIINTCGWVTGLGYETIMTAARSFEVDVVIVMGDPHLYVSLCKEVPSIVQMIAQPRPIEVEPRNQVMRSERRSLVIRNYFYSQGEPTHIHIPFQDVKIFTISRQRNVAVKALDFGVNMEGHLASVCCNKERVDRMFENVSGFVIMWVPFLRICNGFTLIKILLVETKAHHDLMSSFSLDAFHLKCLLVIITIFIDVNFHFQSKSGLEGANLDSSSKESISNDQKLIDDGRHLIP